MRFIFSVSAACLLAACQAQEATEHVVGQDPEQAQDAQLFGPAASYYASVVDKQFAAKDWPAKTLPELSRALSSGELTSQKLTQTYLNRISVIDRSGPQLQSVLSINPDAMAQAEASDERRKAGDELGPLDGIPILFKDNIETLDPIATTVGSFALKDNVSERDSPLVAGLRARGAVILGKTNLSQWANFRSEDSVSGWTSIGGQVRNPHMLDRSPCGSSSGSGAAAAASLAAGTVGTETNGSIICPSNVNGVVGFKPTVGLVSQQYIVPISATQDTAGPMTKTVRGAALMLGAMDNQDVDYASALDAESLAGKRVGVLRFAEGSNADIKDRFNTALEAMEKAGAVLVDIDKNTRDVENYGQKSYDVLLYEFKAGMNEYLADAVPAVATRNLEQLIEFTENDSREMAIFDHSIFDAAQAKGPLTDETYIKAKADVTHGSGPGGIDKMMQDNDVVMLVSPSGPLTSRVDPVNGDVWPSFPGAGSLAAVAGYPHITVPMGEVHGVPIGFSIMAGKGQDADVLSYGYAFETVAGRRVEPKYLRSAEDRPEIERAMRP